jgi:hypothetical protein
MIKSMVVYLWSHDKVSIRRVSRTLHCCWIDNESVINMLDCLEFVGTAPILLAIG